MLQELRRKWRDDFFDRFDECAIESNDEVRKLKLIDGCRAINDWTTKFVQGRESAAGQYEEAESKDHAEQPDESEKSRQDQRGIHDWSEARQEHQRTTLHVDLVAGHTTLSVHAVSSVHTNLSERPQQHQKDEPLLAKHRKKFSYNRRDAGMHI